MFDPESDEPTGVAPTNWPPPTVASVSAPAPVAGFPDTIDVLDDDEDSYPAATTSTYSSFAPSLPPAEPADMAHLQQAHFTTEVPAAAVSGAAALDEPSAYLGRPQQHAFEISVEAPEQVGEGAFAYVTYKVFTKSDYPALRAASLAVVRRYREFLWLHDTLKADHRDCVVPPIPEKNPSLQSAIRLSEGFKQYRRRELERFLRRCAAHPTLHHDPNFLVFLDGSADKLESAQKAAAAKQAGWMSFLGSAVISAAKAVTGAAEDPDPFFKEKNAYLLQFETMIAQMVKTVHTLNARAQQVADMHKTLAATLQATNLSIPIWETQQQNNPKAKDASRALLALGETQLAVEQQHRELAEKQTLDFEDRLRDYSRLVQSVRQLLDYRLQVFNQWQATFALIEAKREKIVTGPAQPKLQAEVDALEAQEVDQRKLSEHVTMCTRNELRRFEDQKANEMRATLHELVQANINHEARSVELWKRFLTRSETPSSSAPVGAAAAAASSSSSPATSGVAVAQGAV